MPALVAAATNPLLLFLVAVWAVLAHRHHRHHHHGAPRRQPHLELAVEFTVALAAMFVLARTVLDALQL